MCFLLKLLIDLGLTFYSVMFIALVKLSTCVNCVCDIFLNLVSPILAQVCEQTWVLDS